MSVDRRRSRRAHRRPGAQTVAARCLLIRPAGRKVVRRGKVVVDDRVLPDGRADDGVATLAKGVEQEVQVIGAGSRPMARCHPTHRRARPRLVDRRRGAVHPSPSRLLQRGPDPRLYPRGIGAYSSSLEHVSQVGTVTLLAPAPISMCTDLGRLVSGLRQSVFPPALPTEKSSIASFDAPPPIRTRTGTPMGLNSVTSLAPSTDPNPNGPVRSRQPRLEPRGPSRYLQAPQFDVLEVGHDVGHPLTGLDGPGIRPESVIVPSVRWKLGRYVTVTVPSSIRNPGVFPSK